MYGKETVIRPTFEVNVKMTDWLKFKADANMNRYYTSIEDKAIRFRLCKRRRVLWYYARYKRTIYRRGNFYCQQADKRFFTRWIRTI